MEFKAHLGRSNIVFEGDHICYLHCEICEEGKSEQDFDVHVSSKQDIFSADIPIPRDHEDFFVDKVYERTLLLVIMKNKNPKRTLIKK